MAILSDRITTGSEMIKSPTSTHTNTPKLQRPKEEVSDLHWGDLLKTIRPGVLAFKIKHKWNHTHTHTHTQSTDYNSLCVFPSQVFLEKNQTETELNSSRRRAGTHRLFLCRAQRKRVPCHCKHHRKHPACQSMAAMIRATFISVSPF